MFFSKHNTNFLKLYKFKLIKNKFFSNNCILLGSTTTIKNHVFEKKIVFTENFFLEYLDQTKSFDNNFLA